MGLLGVSSPHSQRFQVGAPGGSVLNVGRESGPEKEPGSGKPSQIPSSFFCHITASYLEKANRRYFSRDSNQASPERPSFSRRASGVTPALSCRTAKVSRSNCRVTRFLMPAAFTVLPRI